MTVAREVNRTVSHDSGNHDCVTIYCHVTFHGSIDHKRYQLLCVNNGRTDRTPAGSRKIIEVKDNWLANSQTYSYPCWADYQLAHHQSPTS